jgi:hypothetical protein
MVNKSYIHFLIIFVVLLAAGCSQDERVEPFYQAHITGAITVDEELDSSRDYSGIELMILRPDTLGQLNDTLFYAITDESGHYAGDARIPQSDIYSLTISRRANQLARVNLVLADQDTVLFNAELPNVEETTVIESHENDLFRSYERLQSGVNRLFQFANAGYVTQDTLDMEVRKWSDMFWDFYLEHSDSFAGEESAATSISLLEGWQDSLMMERLNIVIDSNPSLIPFASQVGTRYYSDEFGLERAISFIDTLKTRNIDDRVNMELKMSQIKMLYDSARVDAARLELEEFKDQYMNFRDAASWVERFEYDLTSLAPGSELPEFEMISIEGDTITKESMLGTPYLLEFTRLDNFLYQQQFDRNIAIYHIYKNYNVEFITIPFHASTVVMNAFFEERARLWPFAQPGMFNESQLREDFNLNILPTRILVDENGIIIRKYEGTEFNDIVRGLQIVLTNNTEEETS